jgi:hypothetical protein
MISVLDDAQPVFGEPLRATCLSIAIRRRKSSIGCGIGFKGMSATVVDRGTTQLTRATLISAQFTLVAKTRAPTHRRISDRP